MNLFKTFIAAAAAALLALALYPIVRAPATITGGNAQDGVRTGVAGKIADQVAAQYGYTYPNGDFKTLQLNALGAGIATEINSDKVSLNTQVDPDLSCAAGAYYRKNGSAWECSVPAGGAIGTVLNVDSPLSGDGSSGNHLKIPKSDSTHDGYLAQGDWTTFNNKLSSISVAQTVPAEMAVAGSPVTGTGTLAVTWASASGNKFIASPADGSSGAYAGRAAVTKDIQTASNGLIVWSNADRARDYCDPKGLSAISAGNFTVGIRFRLAKSITITGATFWWTEAVARTVKVSLWHNNAGALITSASVAVSAKQQYTVSWTPVTLTIGGVTDANDIFLLSMWETSGTKYATSGKAGGVGVDPMYPTLAVANYSAIWSPAYILDSVNWFRAGDAVPNTQDANEKYALIDPIFTVP